MALSVDMDFLLGLAFSLGMGALIGLERERFHERDMVLAGARTIPLVALFGFSVGYMASAFSLPIMAVGGLLAATAISLAMIWTKVSYGHKGFTTATSIIVVYMMGLMEGYGLFLPGVVLGVSATAILVLKEPLHEMASVLTREEIVGAIEFLSLSLILIPLVYPIQYGDVVGRGKIIDPVWILLVVVLVSGLSFVSFILQRKYRDQKSLWVTGFFGGLANSEATTASLSTVAREHGEEVEGVVVGILFANSAMFIRNILVSLIADPSGSVFRYVVLPLLLMCAIEISFAVSRGKKLTTTAIDKATISSPFAIVPALKFGGYFLFLSLVVWFFHGFFGEKAVYIASIGGLVSSAAVTATVSSLVFSHSVASIDAGVVVVFASTISTLGKIAIAGTYSKDLAKKISLPHLVTAGVGAVFAVLMFFAYPI